MWRERGVRPQVHTGRTRRPRTSDVGESISGGVPRGQDAHPLARWSRIPVPVFSGCAFSMVLSVCLLSAGAAPLSGWVGWRCWEGEGRGGGEEVEISYWLVLFLWRTQTDTETNC